MRYLLVLVISSGILIMAVLMVLIVLPDEELPVTIAQEESGKDFPVCVTGDGISFAGWQRGERRWSLDAASMQLDDKRKLVWFDNVTKIAFYPSANETSSDLNGEAGSAKIDLRTNQLELMGGVEITGFDGVTLTMEGAKWLPKEQKLVSTSSVTLTKDDELRLKADKLDYYCDTGQLRLREGVTGRIVVN